MVLTSSGAELLARWEWGEYIAEAFVIIACAGEFIADLEMRWLTEQRKKRLQRRSTILLVAALSASLFCLIRTNELSGNVIGSLGTLAARADSKARQAQTEAETAQSDARDAETRASDATGKANAVGIRVGDLNKDIDFESPRRRLLLAAAPGLVKILKPYAGQRVGLYMCEGNRRDFETDDTWAAIANILAGDTFVALGKPHFLGANWKLVPTNLNLEKSDCGGMGISVYVSTQASERTLEAGKVLSGALFGVLAPSIYNGFRKADPANVRQLIARGFMDKTSSYAAASFDSDLVTVDIESHPTQ
jgi:hypothetical protein